jgi:hypothetical protein
MASFAISRLAVRRAERYAGRVFESGQNNHGQKIEEWQSKDSTPGKFYAWCCSFVVGMYREVGHPLKVQTASCGVLLQHLAPYVVKRPYRSALAFFNFDGDGWPDHVSFVSRVVKLGPIWAFWSTEGNTSSSGAVSDPGTGRDGVYKKLRVHRRVVFVQLPDSYFNAHIVGKKPTRRGVGGAAQRSQ